MRELYSARELQLRTGLEFFAEPLQTLFGDVLERLKVADLFVVEDVDTRTYSMVLAVKQSLLLQLPGLDGFSLGVVRDSEDEWPLIYVEVEIAQSAHSLSIRHFPLRIEIANPLLRPVPIEGQGPVLDGFSFELEGGFSIATDLSVSATLDSFSLPPFEIVGTGLVLALNECRLVIDADDVDSDITDLGFNQNFRGMHAASALLHWQIPIQLQGSNLPGIHVDLDNIALGNQGVSAGVELNWPVSYQDGEFDPAQTALKGFLLDPDWTIALAGLRAIIRANVPTAVGASGHLRLPFLNAIFGLELLLDYTGADAYGLQAALSLGVNESVFFPLGHDDYQLQVHDLRISGTLDADDAFELRGQTGCVLALPGLTFSAGSAELELRRAAGGETFVLQLGQIDIDTLGSVEQAELRVITTRNDQGTAVLAGFDLSASLAWSDLSARVALNQVPDAFPLPPDDAQMTLHAHWHEGQMQLSVETEMTEVDQLWRFIPVAQRPQVDEASIRIGLTVNGADFDGELALAVRLRLPDLADIPGLAAAGLGELVQVSSGDEAGWLLAEFKAELANDGGGPGNAVSASLENPLALTFNLPGLLLPQPPLELTIDSIAVELSAAAGQTEGEFRFGGGFALRPILPSDLGGFVPAPMATQLERLLAIAHLYDLVGSADMRLGTGAGGMYLTLDCRFENAGLEVDVFDMLAGLTSHLGGATDGQGSEIDLDIEVSFALKKLSLSLGRVPDSGQPDQDGIPFRFGLSAELGFAGQFTEMAFELSSDSLSFGITELAIPITLPQLPLSLADLNELQDATGQWDSAIWQQEVEPLIDRRLNESETLLEQARARLETLESDTSDDPDLDQQLFELQYRTIPTLQKDIFYCTGKKFLSEAILAVHQLLGQLSTPASQATYQEWVERYQGAVDLTLGSLHFDTQLQFVISDALFVLPFNDPSAIRVAGGASLRGFHPDDPLRPLGDLEFRLGVSADAIFFAVEGGADPIPLPDFGRYPGSGIVLDRLLIGYGYNKNSLMIDVAGELRLSPQLVEDADTSRRIGAGLRLPTNNRLKFKIDLIPIVLGEVDFLLPLIAFDVDLRSDNPPAAPVSESCAPAWDGLQFIAPGVLRADFKRARFAPFFGPLPAPNYLYSFDIDIGNEALGLTQVCDTYQVITPVLGTIPIPFLADTTPYFDQLCSNLRVAGFGINFDLRRPFPHPSPLMIFELFGLLSDPSLPIDPAGHLADVMWAELRNARITLPPAVLGMFPEHGEVISRDIDARINVGTVIALGQQLEDLLQRLQARLAQAGSDLSDLVEDLVQHPPEIDITTLLDSLPRELRRVELNGAFVGFDASAVFLLISPSQMRRQLSPPGPLPPTQGGVRWNNVVNDRFTRNPLRGWRPVNHGLKRGLGDWTVKQQALVQQNNVGDNSAGRYGAMLIRETEALSDLRISVDMTSTDNDGMGVVFHVQADTTFYRFRITAEQKEWQLMRLKRGRTRLLQSTETAFKPGKAYRIRIEVRSVRQSGASLPGAFDPRTARLAAGNVRLNRRELSRYSTHIRIWVNDALWCDLADTENPLTEGLVGLDSWWNQGARFDNFVVDRAERDAFGMSRSATLAMSRDLVALSSPRAVTGASSNTAAAWTADDLADFSDADLLLAVPETAAAAVVVAANVKVLGSQVYRFAGVMQSDGGFRLLTTAEIAPLQLSIAGIELVLPLNVHGRLRLEGRAAGANSWARIEAGLYGEWQLLPTSDGAAVTLEVGSEARPVTFAIGSRGDFRARGQGRLGLFGGQLLIDGGVDLSERHAFVAGRLDFAPDLFVVSQERLIELILDVDGRLGPGRRLGLAGAGSLRLFGREFSGVSGLLTQDGLMLEASLNPDNQAWDISGFELSDVQLRLRGRVDFGPALPSVMFEGAGRFELGDLRAEGQCRISAGGGDWCLAAAGNLHWQGRDWLQGAVELCRDRLTIQGQTDFALNLTASQLPANIQIANLYLTASVGGRFTVAANRRLKSCHFSIDWTLAIRLPGGHAQQMMPIATQRLEIGRSTLPNADSVDLVDLIHIEEWTLLPLDGLTVPLPVVSPDQSVDIYLHDNLAVNPPPVTLPVSLLTGSQPPGNPPPDPWVTIPTGLFGDVDFYRYSPSIDVPEFTVPLPILSNVPPDSDPTRGPLMSLPSVDIEDVELSGDIGLGQMPLGLKLAWQGGELGIRVVQTGVFHAFSSLPPLQVISGTLISGLLPGRG